MVRALSDRAAVGAGAFWSRYCHAAVTMWQSEETIAWCVSDQSKLLSLVTVRRPRAVNSSMTILCCWSSTLAWLLYPDVSFFLATVLCPLICQLSRRIAAGQPALPCSWDVHSVSQGTWVSVSPTHHHLIIQVKEVLMNSKLPMDTLGRIWDLSDIDKDGFLDRDEFTIVSKL